MNKVILLGRLTKDPETRYSQGSEPIAVTRYTLAANRRARRQGEQEADFIPCVAFGKAGEFAEKYFRKGQQVGVIGRLQVRKWEDREGKARWTTEVIAEEQYFAEGKKAGGTEERPAQQEAPAQGRQTHLSEGAGWYPVEAADDEDLPF